jgi:hypothetical protein
MIAVQMTTSPTLRIGEPRVLFDGSYENIAPGNPLANYDVTPDGQRFLMVRATGADDEAGSPRPEIHIVLDWFDELRERVP